MRFEKKLIYTAHSHLTKDKCGQIVLFVLNRGYLPLDPFTVFPPSILDGLKLRKFERLALDMKLLAYVDELWVFGETTYGVSVEIKWWEKNKDTWIYSAGAACPHPSLRHVSWEELENEAR